MMIAKSTLALVIVLFFSGLKPCPLLAQQHASFITGEQPSDTYRELLLPLWSDSVGRRLKIEATVVADYKATNEAEPIELPPFSLLEKDEESVAEFFASLRRRQLAVDGKLKTLFDNLTQEQQDGLLGYYILKNGAGSLAHAAVRKRLEISDQQQESLAKAQADTRELNRALWRDNKFYEATLEKDLPALLKASSLRSVSTLLTEKQQVELSELVAASPPAPAYFTLGL